MLTCKNENFRHLTNNNSPCQWKHGKYWRFLHNSKLLKLSKSLVTWPHQIEFTETHLQNAHYASWMLCPCPRKTKWNWFLKKAPFDYCWNKWTNLNFITIITTIQKPCYVPDFARKHQTELLAQPSVNNNSLTHVPVHVLL